MQVVQFIKDAPLHAKQSSLQVTHILVASEERNEPVGQI